MKEKSKPQLTPEILKNKLRNLESQIERHKKTITKLESEAVHIHYIIEHFVELAAPVETAAQQNQSLFEKFEYNSELATKDLLLEIMKREQKPMGWRELYTIFKPIKPKIAEGTVRVSLSRMKTNEKYNVVSNGEGAEMEYFLKE